MKRKKQESNPYERSYIAILSLYKDNLQNSKAMPFPTIEECKQTMCAPGIIFSRDTSWDDVFRRLQKFGYISVVEPVGLEKIVIPLSQEK